MEIFKFKTKNEEDDTVYTATERESDYLVSWVDIQEHSTTYPKYIVKNAMLEGVWVIVEEKPELIFTVKYYNKALNEHSEQSFNKKKEALKFIEIAKSLIEIKDIKLFKTKEININD